MHVSSPFILQMVLEADGVGSGGMPASPISPLIVEFMNETENRLHIKIVDPNKQRWEIPERYVSQYFFYQSSEAKINKGG